MEKKQCQNCKDTFIVENSDLSFYKKMQVPPPTWCPECRFIRKMTFINERSLYKGVCGNCNEHIISMFHPDTPIIVWCAKCIVSDAWDAMDYGKKYDFSRNFFEQFKKLKDSIPHRALDQNEQNDVDCKYSNYCFSSKDIYLSFNIFSSEHIKYSSHVFKNNKNCLDSLVIRENDRGYELIHANSNYNSTFLIESEQCIDSHFLYDCSNCTNCCLSSNLRNKSYVFQNKQLSKEEYKNSIDALNLGTYSGQLNAKEKFTKITEKAIYKNAHIKNSIEAVGDFIDNSKNIYNCYHFEDSENVKYSFLGSGAVKDSQDLIFPRKSEECYESVLVGKRGNRLILSFNCRSESKNLFYCDSCRRCSDCFGCVRLRYKQYCIFNKQYSREEYEALVPRIIEQMEAMPYVDKLGNKYKYGEYFPTELSPFAYNETAASEEYPLSKEDVICRGYNWRDIDSKSYTPTIKENKIPDDVDDVPDSICDEIIECPNQGKIETRCTSAYKILPDELSFYRQMNLPIPRYCPNCRYHQRLVWKNPFRFYERECMCNLSNHNHNEKCPNEFETMYAPERPEMIYCKECYQKEVY